MELFVCLLTYCHPLFRIFDFLLGCIAGRLFLLIRHIPVKSREEWLAHFLFAFLLVATVVLEKLAGNLNPFHVTDERTPLAQVPFLGFLRMSFLHAPFIAITLLYTVRYRSPLSWVLNLRFMVAAGEASYSIYLLHPWLLHLFWYQEHGSTVISPSIVMETFFRIGAVFAFLIVLARGMYLLIEISGKQMVRRIAKKIAPPNASPLVSTLIIVFVYGSPFLGLAAAVNLFLR